MSHFEDPVASLDEIDLEAKASLELVRQTGGAGEVISNHTVFDCRLRHCLLPRRIIATARQIGESRREAPKLVVHSD